MLPLFIIVGSNSRDRFLLMKKLVVELTRRDSTVGVAIHKVHTGGDDLKEFLSAGAHQVMVTTGKEPALYPPRGLPDKRGGITPLRRIAARYFSSVDLLLAGGYHDPLPKIEVCLSDDPGSLLFIGDPNLNFIVFKAIKPALSVPVFTLRETGKLAEFILLRGSAAPEDKSPKLAIR